MTPCHIVNFGDVLNFHQASTFWNYQSHRDLAKKTPKPLSICCVCFFLGPDKHGKTKHRFPLLQEKAVLDLFYLVVERTHLKNMLVKIGSFPQVGMKINNIWNHHLVFANGAWKNIKKHYPTYWNINGDESLCRKDQSNRTKGNASKTDCPRVALKKQQVPLGCLKKHPISIHPNLKSLLLSWWEFQVAMMEERGIDGICVCASSLLICSLI